MGNSDGTYETTTENMLRAYDKLSPSVKKALMESNQDWVPQPLVTKQNQLRKDGMSQEDIDRFLMDIIEGWNKYDSDEHFYRIERMSDGSPYEKRIPKRIRATFGE